MPIAFGIHAVEALCRNKKAKITQAYLINGSLNPRLQKLLQHFRSQRIPVETMGRPGLDQRANSEQHQGVVINYETVLSDTPESIEELLERLIEPGFFLVLDGVQDPHNLGACLRTADAAGVHAVIVPKDNAVGLTPVVRKVACGAAEAVPFFAVTNLARTLRTLRDAGVWVVGAAGESTSSLYQAKLAGPLAIVMGSEEQGLRRLTRELCDELVYIPMAGTVESLNVSVATGICLFEAIRQRKS